jgi:hypothetical protein
VIHDVACVEKRRDWRSVHRVFYTAMLDSGVDRAQAKIMYAAVYHFGPRWTIPGAVPTPSPAQTLEESQFSELANAIRHRETPRQSGTVGSASPPQGPMSLEEIESFSPQR